MKLDVVVPTFNRSALLQKTLLSLLRAPVPQGLEVTLIVVDNNSKDDTRPTVERIAASATLLIVYIHETKQGLSHARNAGISAGMGDLIGFIDDDEEIDREWFHIVAREFANPATHFIGGPYLANWAAPAPSWLPPGYHAAIGHIPPKPRSAFGPAFGANLMGGNAVIRRPVFERVGMYSTRLGRSGKGLLSEEDAEFYRRLETAAIPGIYVPDLIIHHYIPTERLTRSYHRRWVFWRAVSQGVLDRDLQEQTAYLFGVPRYKFGRTLRSALAYPPHLLSRTTQGQAFADELAAWDLIGFIYGKRFVHIDRLYPDKQKSNGSGNRS